MAKGSSVTAFCNAADGLFTIQSGYRVQQLCCNTEARSRKVWNHLNPFKTKIYSGPTAVLPAAPFSVSIFSHCWSILVWAVLQHTDTSKNAKTQAVLQQSDTSKNTKTLVMSRHADISKNTKARAVSQHTDTTKTTKT